MLVWEGANMRTACEDNCLFLFASQGENWRAGVKMGAKWPSSLLRDDKE